MLTVSRVDRGRAGGGTVGRVVGLDLGRRRIGVAVSDPTGTLASPRGAVDGRGSMARVLARLLAELREIDDSETPVARVVVGLPSHLDGRPHEEAAWIRQMAKLLEARAGWPVTLQDERLTSIEAEQRLARRERDWRVRRTRLDAAAAAIILQDYLDDKQTIAHE